MNKNTIRLTKRDLNKIITETVSCIISERVSRNDNFENLLMKIYKGYKIINYKIAPYISKYDEILWKSIIEVELKKGNEDYGIPKRMTFSGISSEDGRLFDSSFDRLYEPVDYPEWFFVEITNFIVKYVDENGQEEIEKLIGHKKEQ